MRSKRSLFFSVSLCLFRFASHAIGQETPPTEPTARPAETKQAEAKPASKPSPIDPEIAKKLGEIPRIGDAKTPDEAGLTRISKTERIWLDLKNKFVVIDGSTAITDGPLEMFACPRRTKEHESVVAVDCKSSTAHAALLAVGAEEGHGVRFDPEYIAATGTEVDVYVLWKTAEGKDETTKAQDWVRNGKTGEALSHPWVFAGSGFARDEETKRSFYYADAGEFICVSNFSTATMDLPIESSERNSARMFEAFAERVPPRGTPVRLVLVPKIAPEKEKKAEEKPTEENKAEK